MSAPTASLHAYDEGKTLLDFSVLRWRSRLDAVRLSSPDSAAADGDVDRAAASLSAAKQRGQVDANEMRSQAVAPSRTAAPLDSFGFSYDERHTQLTFAVLDFRNRAGRAGESDFEGSVESDAAPRNSEAASARMPASWLFSTDELVSDGRVPLHGKRIRLRVSNDRDLQRTVMRSDAASVSLPELRVENPAGVGRFASVGDMLVELKVSATA